MNPYKIVTDATVDMSAELEKELDIHILPMEVEVDGQPFTFSPREGNLSSQAFFKALREGKKASTSQINPVVYRECFETYLSQGMDILYICFSSGLSSTIQSAKIAMEEMAEAYPDRKILCVDSLCASAGEGLFVYTAAKKKQAGMEFLELYQWLEDNKLHLCHWFTVDDLQHLRRGGRVSATTAIVGTALQIKPVLHVDNEGHLINMAKVRGRKKSLSALADHLKETWTPEVDDAIFISQGDCPEDAAYVADCIRRFAPDAEITVFDMGPIIGAHAGPGVVALFFWGNSR